VGMQCIFKHHFPFYNIIYSHMDLNFFPLIHKIWFFKLF
jgi:hypothetical protein